MYHRLRFMLIVRRLRKFLGVPMQGWWAAQALPYIFTGKIPELGPNWKVWEG